MTERTYTSAIERLRALPEIFTGRELTVLFGWKSAIASSYLAHWRRVGLITSLGGHSDVHMNLIRNPHPNAELALRRAIPQAVKVGIDRLRAAGWTTQIPAQPEVAIPQNSARYSVEIFELVTRSAKWFKTVAAGTDKVDEGIDCLRPAWALADMVGRAQDKRVRNTWLPDPEDLDLSVLEDPKIQQDLQTAGHALGLKTACLTKQGYAQVYEDWSGG